MLNKRESASFSDSRVSALHFENRVIRVVTGFAIPLILLFGSYIQFHGEISPGGGFQSGIIFAIAFILHDIAMMLGKKDNKMFISTRISSICAIFGVLCYAGTGLACLFLGRNFLDYRSFTTSFTTANQIGLTLIEIGVCLTVFGAVTLIYSSFRGEFVKAAKGTRRSSRKKVR